VTVSRVREWAESRKKMVDDQTPLNALSDHIIYVLTMFCDCDPKEKDKSTNKRFAEYYFNDATLFELGMYLYFRIDLWHFTNGKSERREDVVNFLMDEFVRIFEKYSGITTGNIMLQNRLEVYETLIKNNPGRVPLFLTELLAQTSGNKLPQLCSAQDPVLIMGFFERYFLQSHINSFLKVFLPRIFHVLEKFYELREGTL
jgi:hypothetical protein